MINKLIADKEKYFWSKSDNKIILGTRDKMGNAILEFSYNDREAIINPVFYPEISGTSIAKIKFNSARQEYIEVKKLHETITDYLAIKVNTDLQDELRNTLTLNSTTFINNYFKV